MNAKLINFRPNGKTTTFDFEKYVLFRDDEFKKIHDNSKCLSDRVKSYLDFVLRRLNIPWNNKMKKMYGDLRVDGYFQNHNPLSMACGVFYLMCVKFGFYLNLREIGLLFGMSQQTVYNSYKKLSNFVFGTDYDIRSYSQKAKALKLEQDKIEAMFSIIDLINQGTDHYNEMLPSFLPHVKHAFDEGLNELINYGCITEYNILKKNSGKIDRYVLNGNKVNIFDYLLNLFNYNKAITIIYNSYPFLIDYDRSTRISYLPNGVKHE